LFNAVGKKLINPKSKETLNKMKIPGSEYNNIYSIVSKPVFLFFAFGCPVSIKEINLEK